jgi:hypothetical protein
LVSGVLSLAREPVRLTLRAWQAGLSTAVTAARTGLELLERERRGAPPPASYEASERPGNGGPPPTPRAAAAPGVEPAPPAEPRVVVPETGVLAPEPGEVGPEPDVLDVEPPPRPEPAAAPMPAEPDHVEAEVVLVAEVAEAGAEDGAGPELHVDEPWDGYDRMTAADIRDRLVGASHAEAAAVELYEALGKRRVSVIRAAERALRA